MGSRNLRKWMVLPLKERTRIEERLKVVNYFFDHDDIAEKIAEQFRQIADLERLISKVAVGRVNPRELLQLKRALHAIAPVKQMLLNSGSPELIKFGTKLTLVNSCLKKSIAN